MQALDQKTGLNEPSVKSVDTLQIGVYTIYDIVLKQYESPFSVQENKLTDYMSLMVNDVQSRFYGHESDYIINKIGSFDNETGEIQLHFVEFVAMLDSYIDNSKRKLQTIIQTLNFLPSGYFKMPLEQKEDIQQKIDSAINDYVSNYVVPDLDVNTELPSSS